MRVLHVVAKVDDASIPAELAAALWEAGTDVELLSFLPAAWSYEGDLPVQSADARGSIDLAALSRVYRLTRLAKPDVVHVHHSTSALAATAAALVMQVPVVRTLHRSHDGRSLRQRVLAPAGLLATRVVVCNSVSTMRSLNGLEGLICSGRCRVIHNGVDTMAVASHEGARDRVRHELAIPDASPVVIGVGRLIALKNWATLIDALAKLDVAGLQCVIVGDGPDRAQLESLAQRCASVRVVFVGKVPRQRVYELLSAGDVFAMPSAVEGFCNAVVEGLAAGLTVVGADGGALPEVLGAAGHLFVPGSADSMAEALDRALSDRFSNRALAAEASRARGLLYTLPRAVNAHRALYRELRPDVGGP